jgi:hypothetical protein
MLSEDDVLFIAVKIWNSAVTWTGTLLDELEPFPS